MKLEKEIAKEIGWELCAELIVNIAMFHKRYGKAFHRVHSEKKKRRKEMNKINKSTFSHNISESIYERIHDLSHGDTLREINLINKARSTNSWINFAMYYMTNTDAFLLRADKEVREFINSITSLAGFGIAYKSAGITDLKKFDVFDDNYSTHSKFLLSFQDLHQRLVVPEFLNAMRARRMQLRPDVYRIPVLNESGMPLGDDGLYHPVFFDTTPIVSEIKEKKGNGILDHEFDLLENTIGVLLDGENYCYEKMDNGLVKLRIERKNSYGAVEDYTVDTGTVMGGNQVYVMGTYEVTGGYDNIFVNVRRYPSIAYMVLQSLYYIIPTNDVATIMSTMFAGGSIYTYIDFSNTSWFDYLSETQKSILANNLIKVVQNISADAQMRMVYPPRLRFSQFTDPQNFTLVSDELVVSPFASTGATSPEIMKGLTFIIQDNNLTKYMGSTMVSTDEPIQQHQPEEGIIVT